MGKLTELLITTLRSWAGIGPFLAVTYLISWSFQLSNENTFYELDAHLGAIPAIIDSIYPNAVEYHGSEVTMGYVYFAAILIISVIVAMKLENKLSKKKAQDDDDYHKKMIDKALEDKAQKEKPIVLPVDKINHFYGLFELKLEYYSKGDKSLDDLEKLKKEFSKMLVEKIKEKYKRTTRFSVSNKIFFFCDKFSEFEDLADDLIKLYQIFYEIDYKKGIKTDLLLSFWTNHAKVDMKTGLQIVEKMNNLNYWNKVIISDKFYLRYQLQSKKMYDCFSLGPARLDVKDFDGQNIEVEIYNIKKQK